MSLYHFYRSILVNHTVYTNSNTPICISIWGHLLPALRIGNYRYLFFTCGLITLGAVLRFPVELQFESVVP